MPRPMSEKGKACWATVRARGLNRYLLMWVPRFGLPWGVFMIVFSYFRPFGGKEWDGWRSEIMVWGVMALFFGLWMAAWQWRSQERRFQGTVF